MANKKQTKGPKMVAWRATAEDRALISRLSARMGVNASNVIRLALRKYAKIENVA